MIDFVTLALAGRQRGRSIRLQQPSAEEIGRIKVQTGVDIGGFQRILRGDDISHVRRSHGNAARENARGQKAIEKRDYALIDQIVRCAHRVDVKGEPGATRPQRFVYHAVIDGDAYEYVETIHRREKSVALKSLLKR